MPRSTRARGAPGRIGHMGIELAGPTILTFGTAAQKARFLLPIARGEEFWCQGYSEPNAGSDLANVRTRAALMPAATGREWVLNGQKIWTSLAQFADWAFVLCRTEEGSRGHRGLSYLLVPMRQQGVTVRPIRQMTGEAEFNETFFVDARTAADNVVGAVGRRLAGGDGDAGLRARRLHARPADEFPQRAGRDHRGGAANGLHRAIR